MWVSITESPAEDQSVSKKGDHMSHEQPAPLYVVDKALLIAMAAFALLATTGGLAFSPVAFLGMFGMMAAFGGMCLGIVFQGLLLDVPSAAPSHRSQDSKVLYGILLAFAVLCVITIVGISFDAVCKQSDAMLDARRGHPKDVTSTLASSRTLGVVAAVMLAAVTLAVRRGSLGTAALVLVYWASYVPLSIAAVRLWGGYPPFGN